MSKFSSEVGVRCSWLEELTQMFWWDVVNKCSEGMEEWLSPDVRIHEGESVDSRGCSGRRRIMASLNLLSDQLHYLGCDMNINKLTTMKKNHGTHTRFIIKGNYLTNVDESEGLSGHMTSIEETTICDDDNKDKNKSCDNVCIQGENIGANILDDKCDQVVEQGSKKCENDDGFAIGFILEWWCDVIVGIIIQRDCDESFCDEVDKDVAEQEPEGLPMMAYYQTFGHSLPPPYLLPKPPPAPPTVYITVLSCENLVSRLKRPVHQQVCCFVTASLGTQKHQTGVVNNSFNPVFTQLPDGSACKKHHHPMVFEIPRELNDRRSMCGSSFEESESASIHIAVEDKRLTWCDRLGNIRIPLSSLKAVHSSGEATALRIPFLQRRRHYGIRERAGIISKNSEVEVIRANVADNYRMISAETSSTSDLEHSMSYLNILISKEDVEASWLMSELEARDGARRKIYREEGKLVSRSSFEIDRASTSTTQSNNEIDQRRRNPFNILVDFLFK